MDNLFIFGDSITHGEFDTECGGWAARLKTYVFEKRLNGTLAKSLYVYPLGIPAEESAGVLARMLSEAKARTDAGETGAILLATGINDSKVSNETNKNLVPLGEFESRYEAILTQLKEAGYEVISNGSY